MRLLMLIIAWMFLVAPVWAQNTEQDDRGYLQALLEDNLSDAGRDVRIKGFKGALSSKASIEELTIADENGIWITLKDVVLEWTRSALLSGEVDVNHLTAQEILLPRLPAQNTGLSPDTTIAQEFSLPDLPVSIRIGEIRADRVVLGAAVLGTKAELALTGSMTLGGGEGQAALDISRTDADGAISLEAGYANSTRILALDLDMQEAAGGIAANLLGLPGQPALSLQIKGKDPLSDYTAQIALSSDGADRLGGTVKILETDDASATGQEFSANLQGDIAPLFNPEYRRFFGDNSSLALAGFRHKTGALEISDLSLGSAALSLAGQLDLNAKGWPTHFQLTGELGDGTRILLPISGPETWVRNARITARFDAAQGNQWQAKTTFAGLEHDALSIGAGNLSAAGTIQQTTSQSVSAGLEFSVTGVTHQDAALAQALGGKLNGMADLNWQNGTPLKISGLDVQSGGARLTGSGTLDGLASGFPAAGTVRIVSGDLARFGPVLNRDLTGQADARIKGSGTLLGGAFDIDLSAQTKDLHTDTARLDPLLKGTSVLHLVAKRDTTGTTLDQLTINNDALSLDASGQINPSQGQLDLSAQLVDVSLIESRLSGPAKVDTKLGWQVDGDVTLQALKLQLTGTTLGATGTLSPKMPGLPAKGSLSASIDDLSRFAALAGQKLNGQLDLTLDGSGALQGQDFQLSTRMNGRNLKTGIAELDQLITGAVNLSAKAGRKGEQIDIRSLSLKTSQLDLKASATNDRPDAPLQVSARLANLGLFAPELSGPLSAVGSVRLSGPRAGEINVDFNAGGPGGTTAQIGGKIIDHGAQMDLSLSGAAPLALANSFIKPRSVQGTADFDLRLRGKPNLAALSGVVRTSNARMALPTLDVAVQNMTATATLAASRAQIDMSGQLRDGGTVTVTGPINMTAPFVSDLSANLENAILTDRLMYNTTINGDMTITGALTDGAKIGGNLTLGETELRLPSTTSAETVSLSGIHHINEPAAVTETRRRAGLIKTTTSAPTRSFPLDIFINAPNRIFVRGRGLDAELGGRIHLTGSTSNVAPSGFFQLIRGRFDILGKRLELTEGLVDLRGALDPYLRFVAETQADDVIVQIIIEGLASEPEITFQSQPELPQEEIVSRLLFGRGLDSISPFQAAQMASAVATLAGRSGNDIIGRIRNTVGLSDLDVTTTDAGATQVRAGAYLSENVYSEVTADSEGRQEINLNLDLSPRVTIKGRLDNEGDTGLGIFFEKDY